MNEQINEWTNKRKVGPGGTKEGISSCKGFQSNTHKNIKHNSWYLLEAKKNICWNSVYRGLTFLLDEAISAIVPSERR